jgi:hypothetical protein
MFRDTSRSSPRKIWIREFDHTKSVCTLRATVQVATTSRLGPTELTPFTGRNLSGDQLISGELHVDSPSWSTPDSKPVIRCILHLVIRRLLDGRSSGASLQAEKENTGACVTTRSPPPFKTQSLRYQHTLQLRPSRHSISGTGNVHSSHYESFRTKTSAV